MVAGSDHPTQRCVVDAEATVQPRVALRAQQVALGQVARWHGFVCAGYVKLAGVAKAHPDRTSGRAGEAVGLLRGERGVASEARV